jgi:pyruvate ferredoxin oxidoreductase beta subunit
VFPLYEVENGKYRLTLDVGDLRPVKEYLKPQGRFRHLTDDLINEIQTKVTEDYQKLIAKTKL